MLNNEIAVKLLGLSVAFFLHSGTICFGGSSLSMKSSVISVSGRPTPQEKYSEFVQAGIGNSSIWDDLQAQSLLGVGGLRRDFGCFQREAPGKASRDRLVAEAITAHGYSEIEVASFLGLHYSTISRILAVEEQM